MQAAGQCGSKGSHQRHQALLHRIPLLVRLAGKEDGEAAQRGTAALHPQPTAYRAECVQVGGQQAAWRWQETGMTVCSGHANKQHSCSCTHAKPEGVVTSAGVGGVLFCPALLTKIQLQAVV